MVKTETNQHTLTAPASFIIPTIEIRFGCSFDHFVITFSILKFKILSRVQALVAALRLSSFVISDFASIFKGDRTPKFSKDLT
jgi:hypothetical protein